MSYAPMNRIHGKGQHKVECPICGFFRMNFHLKKRWDGKMVCGDKCWEPRHPLDFYRTRNDTFKLPFILTAGTELTWTPVFSALTQVVGKIQSYGDGAITISGNYNSITVPTTPTTNAINFRVLIAVTGTSTTASVASTMTLPVTGVTAGTFRVIDELGVILGSGTIAALATTLTLPTWTARNRQITISGQYGI